MNLKIFLTTYLDDQIKLKFLVEDNDGNISYKSSIMDVSDFLAENPVYILNDKLAISAIEVSTYTKNGQVNPYLILTCQNPAIPETPDNGIMDKLGHTIVNKIGKRALLEQMAEEASELAKASLKCIRAEEFSDNPTVISEDQALMNLIEEYTDVVQCAVYLNLEPDSDQMRLKALRWIKRLGEEDAD